MALRQAALSWAGLSPAQTQKMLVEEAVPGLAFITLPRSPSCSLLCPVGATQEGYRLPQCLPHLPRYKSRTLVTLRPGTQGQDPGQWQAEPVASSAEADRAGRQPRTAARGAPCTRSLQTWLEGHSSGATC